MVRYRFPFPTRSLSVPVVTTSVPFRGPRHFGNALNPAFAEGLSPRTVAKHTIRRRGATAERSIGTVVSTVAPRRVITKIVLRGLKSTATIRASLREASAELQVCAIPMRANRAKLELCAPMIVAA